MKMNVRLHFLIDSGLLEKLKKEAEERGMNISELCRERIREGGRLDAVGLRLRAIEEKLRKLVGKI